MLIGDNFPGGRYVCFLCCLPILFTPHPGPNGGTDRPLSGDVLFLCILGLGSLSGKPRQHAGHTAAVGQRAPAAEPPPRGHRPALVRPKVLSPHADQFCGVFMAIFFVSRFRKKKQ